MSLGTNLVAYLIKCIAPAVASTQQNFLRNLQEPGRGGNAAQRGSASTFPGKLNILFNKRKPLPSCWNWLRLQIEFIYFSILLSPMAGGGVLMEKQKDEKVYNSGSWCSSLSRDHMYNSGIETLIVLELDRYTNPFYGLCCCAFNNKEVWKPFAMTH